MYAIVEIGGKQFKIKENDKIYVPLLDKEVGSDITFDKVLLLSNEDNISVGSPFISEASIEAKVLNHIKDDKVMVFKKKRRKSYRVFKGHRQQYTQIQVSKIL
jgi:large subunit ribosomal protein L21